MNTEALYGLVGWPLGHSFSAKYFAEKGIPGFVYRNFPLRGIGELPTLLASEPALRGFNVTIPYKEAVLPYLGRLDPVAEAVGAVNCVAVERDGTLTGYNTDAPAFREELPGFIGNLRPRALVLGSGGASKAVEYALRGLGIEYTVVSRKAADGRMTYGEVAPETIAAHKLIINTTPLGMEPDTASYPPLAYAAIGAGHFMFDLVYNPPVTAFLRQGAANGAKTLNGYGMLVRQADRSLEIWQRTDTAK